jgi:hypothetical protein
MVIYIVLWSFNDHVAGTRRLGAASAVAAVSRANDASAARRVVLVCTVVPAHTEMKHQKWAQRKKVTAKEKKVTATEEKIVPSHCFGACM